MLILEDIRHFIWEAKAFLRRKPNLLIAYLACVTILVLVLWIDSGGPVSVQPVTVAPGQYELSYAQYYHARIVYVLNSVARCHVILLIGYGFYRYVMWARHRFENDEARVTSMRRDTMNAIAHEVRTPLAAILGYAENLRLGICEDKKDYYLGQIETKGHEISRMIDEILSIAKLEDADYTINPERLCVNVLVNEITGGSDTPFIINEKNEWIIDADREYISHMLRCLIDNAVKYRTPDTPITVSISRSGLKIHNQCTPLSDEQLKHIFEFSAKPDGHYSFGLFYCHKAAQKNGLCLRVYNEEDGVTVSLY